MTDEAKVADAKATPAVSEAAGETAPETTKVLAKLAEKVKKVAEEADEQKPDGAVEDTEDVVQSKEAESDDSGDEDDASGFEALTPRQQQALKNAEVSDEEFDALAPEAASALLASAEKVLARQFKQDGEYGRRLQALQEPGKGAKGEKPEKPATEEAKDDDEPDPLDWDPEEEGFEG